MISLARGGDDENLMVFDDFNGLISVLRHSFFNLFCRFWNTGLGATRFSMRGRWEGGRFSIRGLVGGRKRVFDAKIGGAGKFSMRGSVGGGGFS